MINIEYLLTTADEKTMKSINEGIAKLPMSEQDLVYRLRKRAEIRRQAFTRKSVLEGAPDRISDLLEEAANVIEQLRIK